MHFVLLKFRYCVVIMMSHTASQKEGACYKAHSLSKRSSIPKARVVQLLDQEIDLITTKMRSCLCQ